MVTLTAVWVLACIVCAGRSRRAPRTREHVQGNDVEQREGKPQLSRPHQDPQEEMKGNTPWNSRAYTTESRHIMEASQSSRMLTRFLLASTPVASWQCGAAGVAPTSCSRLCAHSRSSAAPAAAVLCASTRLHGTTIMANEVGKSPAAVAGFFKDRAAGLAVAGTIGFAAEAVAKQVSVSLSPLLYATAFGIAIGNTLRIFDPEMKSMKSTTVGMKFAKQRLLRAGIILYGAKVTFAKLLGIGLPGVLTDLYSVSSTLLLGFALGKALGLSSSLVTLIATGSAICGCSAVAATQPIIKAEAHEVACAVGVVVLCGTAAMFLYPFLFHAVPALAANPQLMGIFTGSTVHELAGVVAAGNAMSPEVASTALITKLLRVFLLEPWIIALYYLGIGQKKKSSAATLATGGAKKGKGVPWFAFGFIGVATINSIWGIPPSLQKLFTTLSAAFLASAMAALGLDTDLVKVRSLGWRPIALAMALWVNLLGMGFLVSRTLVGAV